MEQYINKDTLVAEINAFKKDAYYISKWHTFHTLNKLLSSIDTLEVKEVDLNEEIERFVKSEEFQKACGTIRATVLLTKHFFELGMLSTITEEDCKLIWNIGDDLSYMPEEDFFKELLRRYKAQKGK